MKNKEKNYFFIKTYEKSFIYDFKFYYQQIKKLPKQKCIV